MNKVNKLVICGAVFGLCSCGLMYNPAVMMTEEGLEGLTRYNQDTISSAKASNDMMSGGEIRGMYEVQEQHYTERFNSAAKASNPGLMIKLKQKIGSLIGARPQAPVPSQATRPSGMVTQ